MARRQRGTRGPRAPRPRVIAAGGGLAAAATLLSGAVGEAAGTPANVTVTTLGDTGAPAAANVHNHQAPTLADAIAYLDTKPAGGRITFASSLSGAIHLTSSLPSVTRPIDLRGPGAGRLTIENGVKQHAVLVIATSDHAPTELSGATFSGGQNGGIYASTPILVRDATVSHNTSPLGGGGIFAHSAAVTVEDSVISSNAVTRSPSSGGGILLFGSADLTVTESTVSGNTAPFGGGIATYGSGRTVIDGSTISGNTASHNAGGLDLEARGKHRGPDVFVENSTIADNVADGSVGGIYLGDKRQGGATSLTLVGTTISANSAEHGPAGGILDYFGAVELDDSIIAGNHDTSRNGDASPDIGIFGSGAGNRVTARFSLIGDAGDTIFNSLVTSRTDIAGTARRPANPRLKRLAHNGGPTATMLPQKGSPVLRHGNARSFTHAVPGFTFRVDQRGHRRVGRGGSSKATDHTDIGAVEVSRG